MATYTTNLNLKKPDYSDTRNIADINGNMDILDTAVAGKINTAQGAENVGKFLVVNSSGNVVPTTVPFANGVSF